MMSLKNYSEEFVIWLWENKFFNFNQLKTVSGEEYHLIYRGERNFDTGPDFQQVNIERQNQMLHGSLEIHVDPADWYQHGHHQNSVYNQVILHIVIQNQKGTSFSEREDGIRIPIVNLSDNLMEPIEKLHERFLEIQRQSEVVNLSCPLATQDSAQIINVLEKAGAARLVLKGLAFRELRSYKSWDQILYAGFMEALGYSKNQAPFRKLANILPVEFIFRELRATPQAEILLKIQGLLFGAAGLLPTQEKPGRMINEQQIKTFSMQLEIIWEDFRHRIGLNAMHPNEWQFFRLRPQNFPTRRLAGMAVLLQHFYQDGFFSNFKRIFNGLGDNLDAINTELVNMLVCPTYGFWQEHYRFDNTPIQGPKSNLIGLDRAQDIVINIVFPLFLLCANEHGDGRLETLVKACYRRFPEISANFITRDMIKKLFINSKNRTKLINTAQKQQGLIYIYKNYCTKKKCRDCLEF
ncbi:DUF2851 family protein [candidate division KSB1 bacterium]|nr:DUF2851 family protein [candidate division KSB1 bacterium]